MHDRAAGERPSAYGLQTLMCLEGRADMPG